MNPEIPEEYDAGVDAQQATQRSPLVEVEGTIEPVKVSFAYQIGLFCVAMLMVLLPLIYVSLVALFGYAVYYHATVNSSIWSWNLSGRAALFKVIAYCGPLVIGSILMLFLVKPLFARRAEEEEPVSLNHEDAPLLFALIGRICQTIDAPIPSRVDINSEVNASASFRSGFSSLFGNDVKLTIGLPLIAGLSVGEFAGVLAHEFGHFAQGTAMRLSYMVRSINFWFARVVYERDEWDMMLIAASEEVDIRVGFVLYFARLGIWFSRRILWVLMVIGQAISSFMLRQMEYDADTYEVRFAGSEAFVSTVHRLQHLSVASELAYRELKGMWKKNHKLYDSLPEYISHHAGRIPAEVQAKVHTELLKRRTGLFDSHPSDAVRIGRAERAAEPGIFLRGESATWLFRDFGALSRQVTVQHYQEVLGPEFDANKALLATSDLTTQAVHDYEGDQAVVKDYFRGVATSLRPILFAQFKGLNYRSTEAITTELTQAKDEMDARQAQAQEAYSRFKDADNRIHLTQQATVLLEAGIPFNAVDFGLGSAEPDAIQEVQVTAAAERDSAAAILEPFEQAARTRILAATQLIRTPRVSNHLQNAAQLQDEAGEVLQSLEQLGDSFYSTLSLRAECMTLEVLRAYANSVDASESVHYKLDEVSNRVRGLILALQDRISKITYPFPYAGGPRFVSQFAANRDFHPDPLERVIREGNSHVEKMLLLYYRLLGRLVTIATQVEAAFQTGATVPAGTSQPRLKLS